MKVYTLQPILNNSSWIIDNPYPSVVNLAVEMQLVTAYQQLAWLIGLVD